MDCTHRRFASPARLAVIATLLVFFALLQPRAATAEPAGLQEVQSMSCLLGAGAATIWVVAMHGAVLASGGAAALAIVPVLGGALVAGCAGGAVLAPAVWWVMQQFGSRHDTTATTRATAR